MKAKRRRHDLEFKARVALEALKGVKTIQQIAEDFDVHPEQVSEWRQTMTEGAAQAFGAETRNAESEDFERERVQLHAKIEEQSVVIDYLTKKSKQLGL